VLRKSTLLYLEIFAENKKLGKTWPVSLGRAMFYQYLIETEGRLFTTLGKDVWV
jgi:hypothetical protein